MYERYLRIRSTATRLEYLRNPRPCSSKTSAETAALAGAVGSVTSPMLVIVGALDSMVPNVQRLHELVAHSRFVTVPGAPHNVCYETAREWNEAVAGFLETVG